MITLNEAQQAAVTAPDGPVLILAGAGSGKTRVIVERMAYLVEERGVSARSLLALTFTNKAAAEMSSRFGKRIKLDYVPSFIGTFHSFGLFVLRREARHLNRPQNFIVFDDTDQLALMKRLVKELPKTFTAVIPREALSYISTIKQVEPFPTWDEGPDSPEEESYRELWNRYHETLLKSSALDFDDLTALSAYLLETVPEVRERFRERFQHILIDEYQDTNRSQYLIARNLGEDSNLLVVGDEDQSIYSWRGADINNILDFSNDFPDAQVYRLEENYRSTQNILNAANALVAHNVNRLGKSLFTKHGKGDPIRYFSAHNAGEEADFVAQDIQRRSLPPGQVAVFYRAHAVARIMEEALRVRQIPYTIVGGIKFYSRKEIKDILAYLRLAVNPDDDESLRRIINVPPRGIGNASKEEIENYARLRRITLLQAVRECELNDAVSTRARNAAANLAGVIDQLIRDASSKPLEEAVEALINGIDYRGYVKQSDEKESRNRVEIIDEFIVACRQYSAKSEGSRLEEFLQEMALVSDVDQWEDRGNEVTLMTCHCAKGLEFDHVYVIGLEEGLFPMSRFGDEDDDLEEERRLCYVAMTRARKSLSLCAAQSRMVYGISDNGRTPSRFLKEAGLERLQQINYDGTLKQARIVGERPKPVVDPPTAEAVHTGDIIEHARFGRGYVMAVKGSGKKLQARVRFDNDRTRMLMVALAPIRLIKRR
ncbi:MAG: UvrD-helicase domain-containing protein [Candidatus Hydrogenedentes bacterium]|jgi:DNA helicase-2/ATP-dependent DNA helicase PcrA|nr:UvrD-helicase domain-containing protein [Candidatus Hydrogenedentota bacterium]